MQLYHAMKEEFTALALLIRYICGSPSIIQFPPLLYASEPPKAFSGILLLKHI